MEATAECATRTATGFYCYMVVPPIQRILDILLDTMFVGGCRPPLVRELAEQAEVARGAVTDLLRQLATDGWILYDGRTITLLRDGSEAGDLIDQVIDQPCDSDRSDDRSIPAADRSPDRSESAQIVKTVVHRTSVQETQDRDSDRSGDRSSSPPRPPMVHVINKQQVVVVSDSGGGGGGEHAPPAAHVLAELGADPKIIASALRKRPDLSPEQVRATWEYCQQRIAESDGKLNSGIFFHAMKHGQLHKAPPDPAAPLTPADYAGDPLYRLGSDTSGLDPRVRDQAAAPPPDTDETPSQAARRILPPDASQADWVFVACRLSRGDSEPGALHALERHRSAVRR